MSEENVETPNWPMGVEIVDESAGESDEPAAPFELWVVGEEWRKLGQFCFKKRWDEQLLQVINVFCKIAELVDLATKLNCSG